MSWWEIASGGSTQTPFHVLRKACHQARSCLEELFRCTLWSSDWTDAALIRLRRNGLPGLTTRAAWFSMPTRERSSRLVPERRGVWFLLGRSHELSTMRSFCCFSVGSRSFNSQEYQRGTWALCLLWRHCEAQIVTDREGRKQRCLTIRCGRWTQEQKIIQVM